MGLISQLMIVRQYKSHCYTENPTPNLCQLTRLDHPPPTPGVGTGGVGAATAAAGTVGAFTGPREGTGGREKARGFAFSFVLGGNSWDGAAATMADLRI